MAALSCQQAGSSMHLHTKEVKKSEITAWHIAKILRADIPDSAASIPSTHLPIPEMYHNVMPASWMIHHRLLYTKTSQSPMRGFLTWREAVWHAAVWECLQDCLRSKLGDGPINSKYSIATGD